MKIAMSGSSGFIGRHLTRYLAGRNNTVIPIKHTCFRTQSNARLLEILEGCDAVINLAGSSVNCRWTDSAKRRIMSSRIETTRRLVSVINSMEHKPSLFISSSAIGIYPTEGYFTEYNASEGTGFLADVCMNWENEAQKLSSDVRLVIARFGVVLAADGGALPKMLLPFKLFVGAKIGSGKQGFSWIHMDDLLRAMVFVITHPKLSGIVNFVSPEPIINKAFTRAAADVLHRPAWLTLPPFIFRLLYGEGEFILTKGQQVYPSCLLSSGFVFRYSDIRTALHSIVM